MKLFPFIAAVVGSFCFGAHGLASEQDQTYLILVGKGGSSITSIPVKDINQCEEEGAKFLASNRVIPPGYTYPERYRGFECIEGVK